MFPQSMGRLLVILFFLITSSVWCSFIEELREVYVKESQHSTQEMENEMKLIRMFRKLLKAKCRQLPSDNAIANRKKRKRDESDSELAFGVILTYLTHTLANIHSVSKRMALKPYCLSGGNEKSRKTWRLNKWAHTYATLKKEKHDKENNDAQYKFLEKYRKTESEIRCRKSIDERVKRLGYTRDYLFPVFIILGRITTPGISDQTHYVCRKVMEYIFEANFDPSFIAHEYPIVCNYKCRLQTTNLRDYVMQLQTVVNCIYKSTDEKERFAFIVASLAEPQNYFAILDDNKILERNHILWLVGYKTNLLDIVRLSDEEKLEDRNLVFNAIKSEDPIELADLTSDDPDPTNVASSSRTLSGPSEPHQNEIIVVDDDD